MPKPFETERLLARPMDDTDYSFIRGLQTDPEVLKHIADGIPRTEDQTRKWFERSREVTRGDSRLGNWVAMERRSGQPVASLVLRYAPVEGEEKSLELGYTLARSAWGQGLATEAARGIVSYALAEFESPRVVALIAPTNSASRAILVKSGLTFARNVDWKDPVTGALKPCELFELCRRPSA